jgi:hypothetical protein
MIFSFVPDEQEETHQLTPVIANMIEQSTNEDISIHASENFNHEKSERRMTLRLSELSPSKPTQDFMVDDMAPRLGSPSGLPQGELGLTLDIGTPTVLPAMSNSPSAAPIPFADTTMGSSHDHDNSMAMDVTPDPESGSLEPPRAPSPMRKSRKRSLSPVLAETAAMAGPSNLRISKKGKTIHEPAVSHAKTSRAKKTSNRTQVTGKVKPRSPAIKRPFGPPVKNRAVPAAKKPRFRSGSDSAHETHNVPESRVVEPGPSTIAEARKIVGTQGRADRSNPVPSVDMRPTWSDDFVTSHPEFIHNAPVRQPPSKVGDGGAAFTSSDRTPHIDVQARNRQKSEASVAAELNQDQALADQLDSRPPSRPLDHERVRGFRRYCSSPPH